MMASCNEPQDRQTAVLSNNTADSLILVKYKPAKDPQTIYIYAGQEGTLFEQDGGNWEGITEAMDDYYDSLAVFYGETRIVFAPGYTQHYNSNPFTDFSKWEKRIEEFEEDNNTIENTLYSFPVYADSIN